MKTLLILAICVVAAQALTEEQNKRLKQYKKECFSSSKTKIKPKLIVQLISEYFKRDYKPLHKYIICLLARASLMTANGKFKNNIAELLARYPIDPMALRELLPLINQ
ncbi:uncharacterized protein LOC124539031 isoform X2 [Vanessa cardui]|uniref:uncharacterized protein LOC124539031 isoform X2 n=1 Tax=Vanessa cardui TaxID=171605 RepID=UPI001F130856|nr:uncharacterized protein LOC124539031 isoform X2 [Vanessa cardui]